MQADIRGIPVNYEERGEGRLVLLLHGSPTDHRHMVAAFEPIFESRPGWRRIYPDLPGHGSTPGADWIKTDDDKLQVALDLIDGVAPGARFLVIGASYGGRLALAALHHRAADIDGVLLVVTNPLVEGRTVGQRRVFVRNPDLVASIAEDERGWLEMTAHQTEELLETYRASIKPAIEMADQEFLERVEPLTLAVSTLPTPFERPALVINGRQDHVTGYADMLGMIESFPRGTFAVLDEAGHPLPYERPVLFAALVNDWLDRVEVEVAGEAGRSAAQGRAS